MPDAAPAAVFLSYASPSFVPPRGTTEDRRDVAVARLAGAASRAAAGVGQVCDLTFFSAAVWRMNVAHPENRRMPADLSQVEDLTYFG